MTLRIVYRPAAQTEYIDAYGFYADQSSDASERFAVAVESILDEITTNPRRYPIVKDDVREAILTDFPYCIYYVAERDRIRVLSVFHSSRDPQIWQDRR